MLKNYTLNKLEKYAQEYFTKHPEVRLVVVSGSIGKTSAANAIATVLSERYRVAMQERSVSSYRGVPLAILGIKYPENKKSWRQWMQVLSAARKRIKWPTGVDVIVLELNAEHPGAMARYSQYLRPDIAVLTSVTPRRMESFGSVEAIAQEEVAVANFSKLAIINRDDVDGRFAAFLTNPAIDTYGTTVSTEYRFETQDYNLEGGFRGDMIAPELEVSLPTAVQVVGEHSVRPAIAAMAVGVKLGLSTDELVQGLRKIRPLPGRMNVLRGAKDSWVIDDTLDSSPATSAAALQTLYSFDVPQRIALFGDMAGQGEVSAEEHKKLGELCDPNLLSWVVTVGAEAEQYLAPAARARGCQVLSFKTPVEAGGFIRGVIESGGIVLAKGGQDKVFIEEAVKIFLFSNADDAQLIRQSPEWLERKAEQFSRF